MEATTLVLPESGILAYDTPGVEITDGATEEDWLWFLLIVGFLYWLALAYAVYCTHSGGHPYISFSWWKGYTVACYR